MAERDTGNMNLDLNLGSLNNASEVEPRPESYSNVAVNLEDWLVTPVRRVRPAFRPRSQRWRSLWRQIPIPPEAQNLALELFVGNAPQNGQGSVPTDERSRELDKTCENGNGNVEDATFSKKDDGKNAGEEGNFFDCNICLDLAKDPVVTCCGHLFCWPCLYQWIHNYSDAKECPVCKGEVSMKHVTPIYGRGSHFPEPCLDSNLKIPLRPQARRIESWRQTIQRNAYPMEEMLRRLEETFDLSHEATQVQPRIHGPNETLDSFLSSIGLIRDQAIARASENVIDLTENNALNGAASDYNPPRPLPLLVRRPHLHRASGLPNAIPTMNSADSLAADRLVGLYHHSNSGGRIQARGVALPFDDRDSVSSIAAIIHSESQTVDNAIEIESTVSLSTSSSRRRRRETSRQSDGDSGDSRVPTRRRPS